MRASASDEADRDVPDHVAADGPVDVVAEAPDPRAVPVGHEAQTALDPARPFEQHEERQERDGHDRDDAVQHALRHAESLARDAEQPSYATGVNGSLDLLHDLEPLLELAELPPTRGEVVDVARCSLGEVVHLADELRHEGRAQRDDDDDRHAEDDRDGNATAPHATTGEPLDGGVERHGKEQRDQDPDEDPTDRPEKPEDAKRREDDAERREHGPRSEPDDALLHAGDATARLRRPRRTSGTTKKHRVRELLRPAYPIDLRRSACLPEPPSTSGAP
jgi:hypothetical protein